MTAGLSHSMSVCMTSIRGFAEKRALYVLNFVLEIVDHLIESLKGNSVILWFGKLVMFWNELIMVDV